MRGHAVVAVVVSATVIVAASMAQQPGDQPALPHVQPLQAQLHVIDEDGVHTMAAHPGLTTLAPGQLFSIIKHGEAVRRTVSPALASLDPAWATPLAVPEDYFVWGEAEDGSDETVRTRLLCSVDVPMEYNHSTGKFEGVLRLVLEDRNAPLRRTSLAHPVPVEIVSEADEVVPPELSLEHTNLPSSEVRFVDDSPVDSLRVTLRTQADLEGYAVHLPVKPAVSIDTGRRSIHGWGFQSVELPVILKGTSSRELVTVSLDVTRGHVEPSTVEVSGVEPGRVSLRSEALGAATVSATAAGYSRAEIEMTYGFPLAFIVAALLGGFLGGIVGYLRRRQKSQSVNFGANVGMGVVWGVIWAVAYGAMGIVAPQVNVPVYEYFNEGIVFVVSALSAIYMQPKKKAQA
jgi:hypothetical protein